MKNLTQLNQPARFNYGKYTYVPLYDFILSNMLAKYKNFGEAIKAYCFPKLFLGEAIANSLLAGALPMIFDEFISCSNKNHLLSAFSAQKM